MRGPSRCTTRRRRSRCKGRFVAVQCSKVERLDALDLVVGNPPRSRDQYVGDVGRVMAVQIAVLGLVLLALLVALGDGSAVARVSRCRVKIRRQVEPTHVLGGLPLEPERRHLPPADPPEHPAGRIVPTDGEAQGEYGVRAIRRCRAVHHRGRVAVGAVRRPLERLEENLRATGAARNLDPLVGRWHRPLLLLSHWASS